MIRTSLLLSATIALTAAACVPAAFAGDAQSVGAVETITFACAIDDGSQAEHAQNPSDLATPLIPVVYEGEDAHERTGS